MLAVGEAIQKIKRDLPLEICLSVGLSTLEQINYFKSCGVDRLNHNLNTPQDSDNAYLCAKKSYLRDVATS